MLNKLIEEKIKLCERNIEDLAIVFAKHSHKEVHRCCFVFFHCKYAGDYITLSDRKDIKARYCEKRKHIYNGRE